MVVKVKMNIIHPFNHQSYSFTYIQRPIAKENKPLSIYQFTQIY